MTRAGYSLLEILVALTILVIGLAAVFGITQSARHRSIASSNLAAAQLSCQTTLNELLAKQQPIAPIPLRPIEGLQHWKLTVNLYAASQQGLSVIHVTALEYLPQSDIPTGISYQLLRWIPIERVQVAQTTDILNETNIFEDPFQ